MADAAQDAVKVAVATGEGVPYASEGLWAQPADLPAGLYRIASVAFMTDGVSYGDLVRCDVSADGMLVATEVVERSPEVTVAVGLADRSQSDEATQARIRRLLERLQQRYGGRLRCEGGFGLLAVCVPVELFHQLLDTVLADCGPDAVRVEDDQLLGDWAWFVVSDPAWEAPAPIAGADELLGQGLDLVAVDWRGDDPVASTWDEALKQTLREQAATNPTLRRMLDERRYVAAVVPLLRMSLMRELGPSAVGPQPFPLYPPLADGGDLDQQDQDFHHGWARAKDSGGTVRWCADDDADTRFRAALRSLGLDPDADPRQPVT